MVKLKEVWTEFRYGKLLHHLRYRLSRIGINIDPYYWMQEGISDCQPLKLQGELKDYSFNFFGHEEIKIIGFLLSKHPKDMLSRLEKGNKCFGVKHHGQIASFMWIEFDKCAHKGNELLLNDQEAYLFDIYTLKPFRGKNIAPFLRYEGYKALKAMGRNQFYSISDFFNYPSIKFKNKLNARVLWLGLNMNLFGRYRRHWILKRYQY